MLNIFKTSEDVFTASTIESYKALLNIVNIIQPINIEYLVDNFKQNNPNLKALFDRWYKSLNTGNVDYSVYVEDDYLNEIFDCWRKYSRKYLMSLRKYINSDNCDINIEDINNVLDLGCGLGYTTICLYDIFKTAKKIYGTNFKDSIQFKVDNIVCNNFKDRINIIDENNTLSLESVDLVFASEFFEHLDKPIDLLSNLINTYHPKYLIIANTFTQPAIGHFNSYYFNNIEYTGSEISKLFNNTLRSNNYYKLNTGFWNNRPTIWKLNNKHINKLF